MDTQYPHAAYIAMASQPQQHNPFPGFAPQHPHSAPPNSDASTLPPLQHSTSQSFSNLPPLYSAPGQTPSLHASQSSMPPQSAHGLPSSSAPASSGSMPPPSTNYVSAQGVYSTSHAQPNGGNMQIVGNGASSARAMPYTNSSPVSQFPPFHPTTSMPQQPSTSYVPSQESEPTHVVGSQGRRGILPSVPGRAPAPSSITSAAAKALIPQKDADGKFPCPHCTKTYLHAKHLKRHMLRHTGDRPYMCHLCKDTFSRSDILKRHFQKCSIRRGNPTGQNHLAGQRRNTTSSSNRRSTGNAESLMNGVSVSDMTGTPGSYTSGSVPNTVNGSPTVNGDQNSYASSITSMSARSSRANSLIQPNASFGERHGALTGLGLSMNHGPDHHASSSASFGGNLPAYTMRPHSASNPVHPSHYGYATPPINGSMYHGVKAEDHATSNYTAAPGMMHDHRQHNGRDMEWNPMFSVHEQDGYGTQPHQQQDQAHVPKPEDAVEDLNSAHSYDHGFLNSMHQQGQSYGDEAHHPDMLATR